MVIESEGKLVTLWDLLVKEDSLLLICKNLFKLLSDSCLSLLSHCGRILGLKNGIGLLALIFTPNLLSTDGKRVL